MNEHPSRGAGAAAEPGESEDAAHESRAEDDRASRRIAELGDRLVTGGRGPRRGPETRVGVVVTRPEA